jgi:uncharacterized membrane protein
MKQRKILSIVSWLIGIFFLGQSFVVYEAEGYSSQWYLFITLACVFLLADLVYTRYFRKKSGKLWKGLL